tara:strand:- start:24 stop:512 length:489 start_codon:yes stop_codon:yes gene_type:complete
MTQQLSSAHLKVLAMADEPRPLMRRFLHPSAQTLFLISIITIAASIYFGFPHRHFLIEGSIGEAQIVREGKKLEDYAEYFAKLVYPDRGQKEAIILSDRRDLEVGKKIPVFFQRGDTNKMLVIEVFAPWTRSIWLLTVGLAALGLGFREREKNQKNKDKDES